MSQGRTGVAFGRRVVIDGELPLAFPTSRSSSATWHEGATIWVSLDDVPISPAALDASLERVYTDQAGGLEAYRTPRACYWFDEDVGSLCVTGGTVVRVAPRPSATDESLAQFVRGPGLRTAAWQQGAFVVHASAVAVDGRAIAFLGPSGRGKSTAATACGSRGHDVLADDAVAISTRSAEPTVLPEGGPIAMDDTSASVPNHCPVPLATVFRLEDGTQFDRVPLSLPAGAFELVRAADTLVPDRDRSALASHTATAGTIAAAVPIERFVRPRSLSALDAFVARLEAALE